MVISVQLSRMCFFNCSLVGFCLFVFSRIFFPAAGLITCFSVNTAAEMARFFFSYLHNQIWTFLSSSGLRPWLPSNLFLSMFPLFKRFGGPPLRAVGIPMPLALILNPHPEFAAVIALFCADGQSASSTTIRSAKCHKEGVT